MSLLDSVHQELTGGFGLRPQPEWISAITAAISSCEASELVTGEELRKRVLSEVASRVSVPETHLFRNHDQLLACAEHLQKVSATQGRVARLWCAGTATGEEPYSIAMFVDRMSPEPLSSRLEITGSDINPVAVGRAREATYTSWSFRGAPSWCFSYFVAASPGRVTLRPSPIRQVVSFHVESCQAGALSRKDASLDAISFRNVAIYLEESATQELYQQFARLLCDGGLLIIGPSDPRPRQEVFEFVSYQDDAPVFRLRRGATVRPEGAVRPTSTASAPQRTPERRPSQQVDARLRAQVARRADLSGESVETVRTLAVQEPEDAVARRILGQMHLSRGEGKEAAQVLRQAVFLKSEDCLTRYFYALALRETGDARQAERQLKNVIEALSACGGETVLSDEITRASELLLSAKFLEAQWT